MRDVRTVRVVVAVVIVLAFVGGMMVGRSQAPGHDTAQAAVRVPVACKVALTRKTQTISALTQAVGNLIDHSVDAASVNLDTATRTIKQTTPIEVTCLGR